MNFIYNDGGRNKYFKGQASDCVVRAIAIALEKDYQQVYNDLNDTATSERKTKSKGISNSRTGVYRTTYQKYLESKGWKWIPTMKIGQGCKTHLKADELPQGRIIARCSKHLVAVVNGVINDVFDCSRLGTRCVYGYFIKIVVTK